MLFVLLEIYDKTNAVVMLRKEETINYRTIVALLLHSLVENSRMIAFCNITISFYILVMSYFNEKMMTRNEL